MQTSILNSARILIIDDEEANICLLERILRPEGFQNLVSTTESRDAVALFKKVQPDLVLTDWVMPQVDGFAVIQQVRALGASDDYLPILVLSADVTRHTRQAALAAGATDFLTKPFDRIEVLLRIANLLTARFSHLKITEQNAMLEQNVRERTLELEKTLAELKSTQQQVIQQERLAALGTMVGGIAHDFGNALGIVMGYGELLLRDAEGGLSREQAEAGLKMIIAAAENGAKTVDRLLQFRRSSETIEIRVPVNLNTLAEQAVAMTKPQWQVASAAAGHAIDMHLELAAIPTIGGDAAELRDALTNLILNAVDAMPMGGRMTIRTWTENGDVVLEVTDTGTGMTEEVRQRCLEPFYTTKGNRGTGLGLAMVFGSIQRHSGSIAVASEVGKGTTFTLRMPQQVPVEAEEVAGVSPQNGLRILLVDDQPVLCHSLCEYLQKDCHVVETALSGQDALARFQRGTFDVVITDQAMPEMSGQQLAVELKRLNPQQAVILLTVNGDSLDGFEGEAVDLVASKPVSLAILRQALAQVTAPIGTG